jgi:hypothetical protein
MINYGNRSAESGIFMLNLHLQLENLLLDAGGNLKVSDFGLSALKEQVKVLITVLIKPQ